MTEQTSGELQREEWTAAFQEIADADGFITKSDLEVHFQKCNKNPTQADMEAVIEAVELADTDGDGKISLEEFIKIQEEAAKMSFYNADINQELIDALKVYDENNDNTISKDELRGILAGYDDSDLDDVIAAADVNNDGKLSIQEVAEFLTKSA